MLKTISTKTRKAVYARDGHACVLCRDGRSIHLHHYLPRGSGGNDREYNLVCVCPTCHRVLHGEYEYTHDFPFDQATAEDAVHWYLYSCYGDLCTTMFTR